MHKPTLTIGIPAYNEQANISFLLNDLLKQNQDCFALEKIIVYSDGSSDDTESLVAGFAGRKVELIAGKERLGLAAGINRIFSQAQSDIAVILNADISVSDPQFLCRLVLPVAEGRADLAAANILPLPPRTFFEDIMYTGMQFKQKVFESWRHGDNLYTCVGMGRAFSKQFYKTLNIPHSVGEDMYSYLFCKAKGFKYVYVRDAVANFRLPDNIRDHFRQSVRFFVSAEKQFGEFGREEVQKETAIPLSLYLKSGFSWLVQRPLLMPLYVCVTVFTRFAALFRPPQESSNQWAVAESSKYLKTDGQKHLADYLGELFFRIFLFFRKAVYGVISLVKLIIPFSKPSVLVYCYHGAAEDNWQYSINVPTLKKQVEYLLNTGRPISAEQLEGYLAGQLKLDGPSFLICFDDGYKNILSLKDFFAASGIRPVVFALSSPDCANRKELGTDSEFLSRDDLLELKVAGWSIGCHSATHADFGRLSRQDIQQEIVDSKQALSRALGFEVKYFAYPKGRHNREILDAVKRAGYSLAFSMDEGRISPLTDKLAIPRIGVDRTHAFYEFRSLSSPPAMAFRKFFKSILGM